MKYKLTEDKKNIEGNIVYRIQAVQEFSDVKEGDFGGWIESEDNLSQDGNCWVYGDAVVRGRAKVLDNAKIKDNVMVFDYAQVSDDAVLCDYAQASDNARVYGKAMMFGWSRAYNNAEVFGNSKLKDNVRALLDAWVYGDVEVSGKAYVTAKCTRTPLVLMGLPYTVTIMDDELSFDCQSRTTLEWMEMTNEELMMLDKAKAVRFFNKYRDQMKYLADMHQGGKNVRSNN